jgi:GTP-binding protein
VERRFAFIDYACVQYISALHGTGVGKLFDLLDAIGVSQQAAVRPAALTRILEDAVERHAPPLIRGRRIKLRYAHLGGHDPLRIIIHGNQTEKVPEPYRRYLASQFRERLHLVGTPVLVEFKRGDNPYKGKKASRKTGRKKAKRKARPTQAKRHK